MTDQFESLLGRVSGGESLTMDEMAAAIDAVMAGTTSDEQIGLLLMSLRAKGETVEEIAGAAAAMRKHMTPIRSRRDDLLDTCGTGGDGSATFNISTAAAIVAAAAGAPIAKHGNRSITSKTGSADVLAELGVNIDASVSQVEACLDEVGLCFCFAPLLHPAMKNVAHVRRKLGVPTIFNLLGPLANPAGAAYQLLGVGRAELRPQLANALSLLGTRRAMVVCGSDGLDEVTLSGETAVSDVRPDEITESRWQPADFGVAAQPLDSLRVDGPAASAAMIRRVLAGEQGPPQDIVVLNAAVALIVAGKHDEPTAAAAAASEAISSGEASRLLHRLAERSHA